MFENSFRAKLFHYPIFIPINSILNFHFLLTLIQSQINLNNFNSHSKFNFIPLRFQSQFVSTPIWINPNSSWINLDSFQIQIKLHLNLKLFNFNHKSKLFKSISIWTNFKFNRTLNKLELYKFELNFKCWSNFLKSN